MPMGDPAPTPGTPQSTVPKRLFPDGSAWYRDISGAARDFESAKMIDTVAKNGGFGMGEMRIGFEFELVTADGNAPMIALTPAATFFRPDCDEMPVPLPLGGALRGEASYQCTLHGECHLLVHHLPTNRLYEMWSADVTNGVLSAGCQAVWDLTRVYSPIGRGSNCASADAAGMPIAALLFTADEVAAGEIPHALRFNLPVNRMRKGVYVAPATQSNSNASGNFYAPPMGARFRLRADYPVAALSPGGQVVARALQRYGMFLSDAGPKALTARSDRSTTAKWTAAPGGGPLLGERDLAAIQITDFDVVDGGDRIRFAGACLREP